MGTIGRPAVGCSAFVLTTDQRVLVGRNLDVGRAFSGGYLLSNPRGSTRRSVLGESRRPAEWTAQYGSVTFNLFGRGFPVGGMNERGLVVEHLALPDAAYPDPGGNAMVLEFEWIQYMLDTCATVEEVLVAARKVTIAPERIKMHFLVCDASGEYAVLEFLEGGTEVYRREELRPPAIANSTYAKSLRHLRQFSGHGGTIPLPKGSTVSLDRFAVVADQVTTFHRNADDGTALNAAFDILKSVTSGTLLSVVYEPKGRLLHYRSRGNATPRRIDMAGLDFSAKSLGLMLDMHAPVADATPFSTERNNRSVDAVVPGHGFLKMDAYVEKMKSAP